MTLNEIRSKYLAYMEKQGHVIIPSASLVPENDPTTLFTGSGMQPLIPYLLGENHPAGVRLTNSQKCFRSMDIEEVGDNRHTTFFEMLGNWSLGDYFKQEQLPFFFHFLTDEVGLKAGNLYVTVFIGDEKNGIPKDTKSAALWKKLFAGKNTTAKEVEIGSEADGYGKGMQGGRIFYYDASKNWWSRAGTPDKMPAGEPGGPDSEVFYDFGTPHDKKFGEHCHPNCDCGRFLEIGNSVFMEYVKNANGTFGKLPKRNVDFGGGLERIGAVSIGSPDVFKIDALAPVVKILDEERRKLLPEVFKDIPDTQQNHEEWIRRNRILADHLRAGMFLISDGVMPGNKEREYVLRRLLRRTMGEEGIDKYVERIFDSLEKEYKKTYPNISSVEATKVYKEEFLGFQETAKKGFVEIHKKYQGIAGSIPQGVICGKDCFYYFSTFGIPKEAFLDTVRDYLKIGIFKLSDSFESEYANELIAHSDLSRAGSEQKFKGGLADTAEKTVRLHTAHHLLLRALQIVLGEHVKQRGSNITQERLRIDFAHPEKMTKEQLAEVERIVNEKMDEDLPAIRSEMASAEAEKLGAEHEFGQKYPERVSVYSVGPKGATAENPQFDKRFSIEFCGGPHVSHTGELAEGGKRFKIQKEEAVAAGIRRIKAVLA